MTEREPAMTESVDVFRNIGYICVFGSGFGFGSEHI